MLRLRQSIRCSNQIGIAAKLLLTQCVATCLLVAIIVEEYMDVLFDHLPKTWVFPTSKLLFKDPWESGDTVRHAAHDLGP